MSLYPKRKLLDWIMLAIVGIIAFVVILLSFKHTTELARKLDLNPYATAGLVELLFGSLLFLRGRQRALKRNVPLFIEMGYFASFLIVTAVNVYGLHQKSPAVGPIVGISISGAMWLMESTFVWLWTAAHEPHKKSLRERMREAKKEIQEEKIIQRIEWMKWESKKPDLKLIQDARAEEEKRKKIVGDGLPEFFLREPEPVKQKIVADPITILQESGGVFPMRKIGFHMEPKPMPTPGPSRFQPNLEARAQAIETAKSLKEKLGRIPTKKELIERGLTDHYSRVALEALKGE